MSKHMDKWAQSHRPERHPASAEHMDTMVVIIWTTRDTLYYEAHALNGYREQAQAMECKGQGRGPFGTTALES